MTNAELKSYREHLGLSIHHLAKLTNVTFQRIKEWENTNSTHLIVPDGTARILLNLDVFAQEFAIEMTKIVIGSISDFEITDKKLIFYRFQAEEKLWQKFPLLNNLPIEFYMTSIFRAKKILEDQHNYKIRIDYAHAKDTTGNWFSFY